MCKVLANISLGGHQHNEGKGYHASNWTERESLTLVDPVGGRPDAIIREEGTWQCQENPWNSKEVRPTVANQTSFLVR